HRSPPLGRRRDRSRAPRIPGRSNRGRPASRTRGSRGTRVTPHPTPPSSPTAVLKATSQVLGDVHPAPTRRSRSCLSVLQSSQLATSSVDLTATCVTHRGGDSTLNQPVLEGFHVFLSRASELTLFDRVERDEVDVHPAPVAVRPQDV